VKKNIIIVGYPKSGSTWVTRLTAEVIGCPVAGFWQGVHKELAVEGDQRSSEYQCFKSHHTYDELTEGDDRIFKIIYVLRDPRDVVISAKHFFRHIPVSFYQRIIRKIPFIGKKLHQSHLNKYFIEGIINGNAEIHGWMRISWKEHYSSYLEKHDVIILRYEDFIDHPERELVKILEHLEIERTPQEISNAIRHQSKEERKKEFLEKGDMENYHFIRSGSSGNWREEFSGSDRKMFRRELKSAYYNFND